MKYPYRQGGAAVREHIISGLPISKLEALVCYGVADLGSQVRKLRKEGLPISWQYAPRCRSHERINEMFGINVPQPLFRNRKFVAEYQINKLDKKS